jgi:hypothetical protein
MGNIHASEASNAILHTQISIHKEDSNMPLFWVNKKIKDLNTFSLSSASRNSNYIFFCRNISITAGKYVKNFMLCLITTKI